MRQVIIGGGIIGLSAAYELASRGHDVSILEREQFGRKSSWAGAGILIPANPATAIHPMEHLEAISHRIHERWSEQLLDQTGIDNEFRKCGGLYVARTIGESAALTGLMSEWSAREIEFQILSNQEFETRFAPFAKSILDSKHAKAIWVPGESQFSNPRQVEALIAGCKKLNVSMHQNLSNVEVEIGSGKIKSIWFGEETISGDQYLFAAGPWTEELIKPLEVPLPMQPVRGQIAMYKLGVESNEQNNEAAIIVNGPIVNEGSRYLVPRRDGCVLAGATIEEVGFDCQTSEPEIADLRGWAESLSDQFNDSTFVKSWAGLRPGTYDGFPYLGRLGSFENAFVATGHFKSGLHLSTGTAIVMADLLESREPKIDLQPFSPLRAADHQSKDSK